MACPGVRSAAESCSSAKNEAVNDNNKIKQEVIREEMLTAIVKKICQNESIVILCLKCVLGFDDAHDESDIYLRLCR